MPVKIPTLQRIAPQATPTVGRIKATVPDVSRTFEQVAGGVADLGKQLDKKLDDIEKATAHTEKIRIGDEYEKWHGIQLNGQIGLDGKIIKTGIIHLKGDPTKAYADLRVASKVKLEELKGSASDYSDRVKTAISNELFTREGRLYNKSLTSWGYQNSIYRQRNTDDSVKLSKRDTVSSVGLIKPKDPATTAPFDEGLRRMTDTRINHAIDIGAASLSESIEGTFTFKDADGKQARALLNESVKNQIKKDTSEAIRDSVKTLLNVKQTATAKFMLDTYGDRIEPETKSNLTKLLKDGNIDNEAFTVLNNVRGLSLAKQKEKLDKVSKKNPEVGEKARALLDAHQRRNDNLAKRDSTEAHNSLSLVMQKRAAAGKPMDSLLVDIENDPELNSLFSRITNATQKQAIRDSIKRPGGESNHKALTKINNAYTRGEFKDMSFANFDILRSGLNSKHANQMHTRWLEQNKPETISQQRGNFSDLQKVLKRKALAGKLLKTGRDRKTLTRKSERIWNSLLDDLDERFPDFSGDLTEQRQFLNQLIREREAKEFPDRAPRQPDRTPRRPTPREEVKPSERNTLESLSTPELRTLNIEYRKQFPGEKPTVEQLKKFHAEKSK